MNRLLTYLVLAFCTSCAIDRQGIREIQETLQQNAEQTAEAINNLAAGTATAEDVVEELLQNAQDAGTALVGIQQRSTARNLNAFMEAAGKAPGVGAIEVVGGLAAAAFAAYAGKRAVDGHGARVESRAVERVHRERNAKYVAAAPTTVSEVVA